MQRFVLATIERRLASAERNLVPAASGQLSSVRLICSHCGRPKRAPKTSEESCGLLAHLRGELEGEKLRVLQMRAANEWSAVTGSEEARSGLSAPI